MVRVAGRAIGLPNERFRREDEIMNIHAMVNGYLACALWSSLDDNDEPLDNEHRTLHPKTLADMREDCEDFATSNAADLLGMDPELAGHDFWLTRNHHGAGFWDRGLGERGERLTKAANAYGSVDLYVGDDGQVYGS